MHLGCIEVVGEDLESYHPRDGSQNERARDGTSEMPRILVGGLALASSLWILEQWKELLCICAVNTESKE